MVATWSAPLGRLQSHLRASTHIFNSQVLGLPLGLLLLWTHHLIQVPEKVGAKHNEKEKEGLHCEIILVIIIFLIIITIIIIISLELISLLCCNAFSNKIWGAGRAGALPSSSNPEEPIWLVKVPSEETAGFQRMFLILK